MKFIKAVLVVVFLVVAVLLLIGVFVPEVDDQFETRIDQTIVGVYAGMLNTQDLPQWNKGMVEVKQTSGILAMPGSTFEVYYQNEETDNVYIAEVLELVPLESIKVMMFNDMMEMNLSIQYETDGLSTLLTTYVQIKGKGIVARSFLPLVKSVLMEEVKQNFASFKQLQEGED